MVPLEMPKNIWFRPIFFVCNLIHELTIGVSFSQFASLASLKLGFKCVVYDLDLASGIELKMAKRDEQRNKCKLYEGSKKFQDTWTTKLPWAKSIFDEKGEVQQVRCKVCTSIEGK